MSTAARLETGLGRQMSRYMPPLRSGRASHLSVGRDELFSSDTRDRQDACVWRRSPSARVLISSSGDGGCQWTGRLRCRHWFCLSSPRSLPEYSYHSLTYYTETAATCRQTRSELLLELDRHSPVRGCNRKWLLDCQILRRATRPCGPSGPTRRSSDPVRQWAHPRARRRSCGW